MEDLYNVKSLTVTIAIPAVREEDGTRIIIPQDELEQAAGVMQKEMDELGFDELVRTVVRSIADEHFLGYHPVVDTMD